MADTKVSATHALVVVRVNLAGRTGWDRLTPLILAGDAMRTVFDGGQTLARLADHMAVALTEREPMLARRTHLLAGLVLERLGRDQPPRRVGGAGLDRAAAGHAPAAVDLIGELASSGTGNAPRRQRGRRGGTRGG